MSNSSDGRYSYSSMVPRLAAALLLLGAGFGAGLLFNWMSSQSQKKTIEENKKEDINPKEAVTPVPSQEIGRNQDLDMSRGDSSNSEENKKEKNQEEDVILPIEGRGRNQDLEIPEGDSDNPAEMKDFENQIGSLSHQIGSLSDRMSSLSDQTKDLDNQTQAIEKLDSLIEKTNKIGGSIIKDWEYIENIDINCNNLLKEAFYKYEEVVTELRKISNFEFTKKSSDSSSMRSSLNSVNARQSWKKLLEKSSKAYKSIEKLEILLREFHSDKSESLRT